MSLKIGSLCTGYGGLDMAVEAVLDARTAWVSDIDKGACKVLAHRYPGVPNLGDMTAIDWTQVEPVDVITGGTPCQDLSHAGKRAGMTEGTRSNLWVAMREAIATIRPSLVIWENVAGAYSATAESEMDCGASRPCVCGGPDRRGGLRSPGHAEEDVSRSGDRRHDGPGPSSTGGPARGLGRNPSPTPSGDGSLGSGLDLAGDRNAGSSDADGDSAVPPSQGWTGGSRPSSGTDPRELAGDVPWQDVDRRGSSGLRGHQAADACAQCQGTACQECGGCLNACADSEMESREGRLGDRPGRPALRALGRVLGDLASLGYVGGWHGLRAADIGAPHGRLRVFVVAHAAGYPWRLLDGDGGSTADADGGLNGTHGDGGLDLRTAVALLPTPAAQEPGGTLDHYHARLKSHDGRHSSFAPLSMAVQELPTPSCVCAMSEASQTHCPAHGVDSLVAHEMWGQYADAIARWEYVLGRLAPPPTELGAKGNPQLSPAFTEWMMGLPAGWITDVPGVTRNEALKLCGNGVVPQQAAAAIRFLLPLIGEQVAA